MRIELKGARILITAGASGIGRVIADTFMEAGARIYVCNKSQEDLNTYLKERPEAAGIVADVASPDEVQTLFDNALRELKGLDVLINNAGIAGPTAPVEDIGPSEWAETLAVNINGQFHCARLAVPELKKAGSGCIINISSVAGRLGYPLRTPYAASKWAVIGFTKSLAMELGPNGIRVNAILPGLVEGQRIRGVIGARAKALGVSYEEMEAQYLAQVSLRRMVSAQDVANTALFLCSEAGANISGEALSVCGNVEVLR
jgi:NAD(P)-dependent dehydrogenase (short-subunit alcohol dehydrogenase family)